MLQFSFNMHRTSIHTHTQWTITKWWESKLENRNLYDTMHERGRKKTKKCRKLLHFMMVFCLAKSWRNANQTKNPLLRIHENKSARLYFPINLCSKPRKISLLLCCWSWLKEKIRHTLIDDAYQSVGMQTIM